MHLSPCMARLVSLEDSMVSGLTRMQLFPQLVRLRVKPGEYMLKSPPLGSASSLQHQLTCSQACRQVFETDRPERQAFCGLSPEILAGLAQSHAIQHGQTAACVEISLDTTRVCLAGLLEQGMRLCVWGTWHVCVQDDTSARRCTS